MPSTMLGFLHTVIFVLAPVGLSPFGSHLVAARYLLQFDPTLNPPPQLRPPVIAAPSVDKSTFPAFQEPLLPPNLMPLLPFPPFPHLPSMPTIPSIPSLPLPTGPTLPSIPGTVPSFPSLPGGVPIPPIRLRSSEYSGKLMHNKKSP